MTTLPLRRTETMVVKGEISTQRGDECPNALDMGHAATHFNQASNPQPSVGREAGRCDPMGRCTGLQGSPYAAPTPAGGSGSRGTFGSSLKAITLRSRTGIDLAAGTLLRSA